MEHFDFDGMRIAYVAHGQGEPVVMLHNGGATHAIWGKQIEALSTTRRVYALDLLGFGESARPADPHLTQYTLDRHVDVLAAFLAHNDLSRPALVGNCMGSAISLAYARRHPEAVCAIVACNPLTQATAMAGGAAPFVKFGRWQPTPVFRALGKLTTPRRAAQATARFLFSQSTAYRRDRALLTNLRSYPLRSLGSVALDIESYGALDRWDRSGPNEIPVCTVWGIDNPILSAESGRQLNETLRPVREEWLQPGSHLVMLERADEITAIVNEFLTAHQPTSEAAGH